MVSKSRAPQPPDKSERNYISAGEWKSIHGMHVNPWLQLRILAFIFKDVALAGKVFRMSAVMQTKETNIDVEKNYIVDKYSTFLIMEWNDWKGCTHYFIKSQPLISFWLKVAPRLLLYSPSSYPITDQKRVSRNAFSGAWSRHSHVIIVLRRIHSTLALLLRSPIQAMTYPFLPITINTSLRAIIWRLIITTARKSLSYQCTYGRGKKRA